METDAMTQEPRSIDELLRMDSYADMTDEEINRVIEWHAEQAKASEELRIKQEATSAAMSAIAEQARLQREYAQAQLDALIANAPQFQRVEVNSKYDPY